MSQQNQNKKKTKLEQIVPCHLHTDLIFMILGRTELIIAASNANFCGESFGEVRFDVARQKPSKNAKTYAFEAEQIMSASKHESSGIV